ncbi:hypothetical protein [Mycobacterium talmoniae]|nr:MULTISPECIES: hypothetical protein [Mycobacterium]TDH49483.1 hypothetical protein E2F47_20590 [Mycobacterium eburneum]
MPATLTPSLIDIAAARGYYRDDPTAAVAGFVALPGGPGPPNALLAALAAAAVSALVCGLFGAARGLALL